MGKGQTSASSIMTLLILLALFIVLYVLLLPPGEREALLHINESDGENVPGASDGQSLLYELPGKIIAEEENQIEHNLDTVNLFLKSEPIISLLSNSIEVERSAFSNQDQTLSFNIDSLSNVDKTLLTFTVKESSGRLLISINGQEIYNKELKRGNQEIIQLPNDILKEKNELKFSVSGPGVLFFMNNRYKIENIRLKKQLEIINAKESRSFSASSGEKDNLESSRLDFYVYCNSLEEPVTSLKVYLNEKVLSSSVISCSGGQRGFDLDVDDIKEGKNEFLFVIDTGDFTISQIKVTNKLKQGIFKVYEFDLSRLEYNKILNQEKRVLLRMTFEDDKKNKKGKLLINEDQVSFDTSSDKFAKDISKNVNEDINKLRIIPEKDLTINTLRISLEEA